MKQKKHFHEWEKASNINHFWEWCPLCQRARLLCGTGHLYTYKQAIRFEKECQANEVDKANRIVP
jgi:hypothetical protein